MKPTIALHFQLDPDIYKRFKKQAVEEEVTMKVLITRIIEEYLTSREAGKYR